MPESLTSQISVPAHPEARGNALIGLSIAALGVVYGDIGTSPLYAFRECFNGPHATAVSAESVLGVLSLMVWSLITVVCAKYLTLLMRADNHGEGGIFALLALLGPSRDPSVRRRVLFMAGVFGAALLYGDGMITPSITVLGAVEGLSEATPALTPYVVPISVVILVVLFLVQQRGTAKVGAIFGPICMVWFAAIAALGLRGIVGEPRVLAAFNPILGITFVVHHGFHGFLLFGSVVLTVTGAEALYADMGHFGKSPIRWAWYVVVLPSLLCNYFGQGAWLIQHPDAATNPFYALVPSWGLYPMVGIATLAACVASQALISGAYSLTQQAHQLGYSPRVTIVHTSDAKAGQIYIPEVNYALMLACVGLTVGFGSSARLAGAYGLAVTGTMLITTALFYTVARRRWMWSRPLAMSVASLFMVVDVVFLAANVPKIPDGGWFPLVMGVGIFVVMFTWKQGRDMLAQFARTHGIETEALVRDVASKKPYRIPGTAIFMSSDPETVPPALLHHLKHNKVLHERVLLLSFLTEDVPRVAEHRRVECKDLGEGFYQVTGHYGFVETPYVPAVLRALSEFNLRVKPGESTFYLGRQTLLPVKKKGGMALWRKRLFVFLTRNAPSASTFFSIPPNRVVDMGAQVEI